MKVYTVTFPGVWLGGTAVIVAEDKANARRIFNRKITELRTTGRQDHERIPRTIEAARAPITEIDTETAGVHILDDGNY